MDSSNNDDLIIGHTRRDRVRMILFALAVPAVLIGVEIALGLTPVTLAIWSPAVAYLTLRIWRLTFVVLTGELPALTAEGVRMRPRPMRRTNVTLPWSAITSLGIVPTGPIPRRYLKITTADTTTFPGPRRNGVNFLYLSPAAVTPQQVKDAVNRLTQGQVIVRDEAPQRSLYARTTAADPKA